MSTLAFVPVRGGSKSIPLKNIKPLYGRPLVYWVLKSLQLAKKVDRIVVATDRQEIVDTVNSFGFSKVDIFLRSDENAADHSSTESVMFEYLEAQKPNNSDLFILAQATSPFTKAEDFDQAIDQFQKTGVDSLLTCCRLKRFFWNTDGTPINYNYKQRPRRQNFQGTLVENGAFYISSVQQILLEKNRISGNVGIYEMPEYTFLELDEPQDWEHAEQTLRKLHRSVFKNKNIKLVLSDIDGVLTDAGMYYTENGDEFKKFSTYDGMAFQLLKEKGIKTGLITSENRVLNKRRSEKIGVDFLFQGAKDKLLVVKELCANEGISLQQVAYVGDDINDEGLLSSVGFAACPSNAIQKIKNIPGIHILQTKGGNGAVRELADLILQHLL
jgi:N-acylneuraminate cytidylyltransferase